MPTYHFRYRGRVKQEAQRLKLVTVIALDPNANQSDVYNGDVKQLKTIGLPKGSCVFVCINWPSPNQPPRGWDMDAWNILSEHCNIVGVSSIVGDDGLSGSSEWIKTLKSLDSYGYNKVIEEERRYDDWLGPMCTSWHLAKTKY